MIPQRIKIKFFAKGDQPVEAELFVAIFHGWIRNQLISDILLIDVADYKHVPNGPGVMLIGHQADYAVDYADGRPGLLYVRKRQHADSFEEDVRLALNHLVQSAELLAGQLDLNLDEAVVTIVDELAAPNSAETFDHFAPSVQAVFSDHFGRNALVERVENDTRLPIQLRVFFP